MQSRCYQMLGCQVGGAVLRPWRLRRAALWVHVAGNASSQLSRRSGRFSMGLFPPWAFFSTQESKLAIRGPVVVSQGLAIFALGPCAIMKSASEKTGDPGNRIQATSASLPTTCFLLIIILRVTTCHIPRHPCNHSTHRCRPSLI